MLIGPIKMKVEMLAPITAMSVNNVHDETQFNKYSMFKEKGGWQEGCRHRERKL